MGAAVSIDGGILVGHDGSKSSSEAVSWAAGHAARLGVPLHVMRAWVLTNAPRPKTMEPGFVPPEKDFEEAVLEQLARDVEAMHLHPDCTLELHAAHGQSSAKLLEAAVGAEMLVVGRRGAGGFRGLLTGSTADQVVRHSPCPVVVVPIKNRGE
jgi:nucleotide-binding universal stress UspA family protein